MSTENFDQKQFYKNLFGIWEKTIDETFKLWSKSPFTESPSNKDGNSEVDPKSYYKKFYSVWEQNLSEALESWLKTPYFSATVGKGIERSSELKKYFDQVIERSLKTMHMPTKGDVNKALAAINKIEEKVNDLIDKVDELNSYRKK
ncbi:MAG: hypothetical protein IH874_01530 [Candidatus Dadabacteria bacterium]|nr:hypothetical protein [Candidatus Dadabacteria bacterium]